MIRENVFRAIKDPRLLFLRLQWQYHRRIRGEEGIKVMEQDWDNLIILDACRYDLFAELSDLPGILRRVVSAGSHTKEFLHANFDRGEFGDTVYVTATPQFKWEGMDECFHYVLHAWKSNWDDELRTVPPKSVADRTREVAKEYSDKRVIAHFVQPHYPFIGDRGKKITQQIPSRSGLEATQRDLPSIWNRLAEGDVSETEVRTAYRENLELTLPVVGQLVQDLQGKTVVTSDHGNAFGRWGIYGHPPKKYLQELIEVPWLVMESNERRSITDDGTVETVRDGADSDLVEKRLVDLGYMN